MTVRLRRVVVGPLATNCWVLHGAGDLLDQRTPLQQRRVAGGIENAEDRQAAVHVVEESLLQRVGEAGALPQTEHDVVAGQQQS